MKSPKDYQWIETEVNIRSARALQYSELMTMSGKLTTATLPEDETAPTARPDCLNAFLNIILRFHRWSQGEEER